MAAVPIPISKLDDQAVRDRLSALSGWELSAGKLHREFLFRNFIEAFAFMTKVALLSESKNHHPDWSNVYNRVVIDLNTHDVGGISERDFDLAGAINALFET